MKVLLPLSIVTLQIGAPYHVIHRRCQFQSGPFACEQNGRALVHLNEALAALHDRTTDRCTRGVEGTSQR